MIIVYTGNGKGKTTAALGLALRALGWGGRVLIVQFLKKQVSGEIKALTQLKIKNEKLKIERFGTKNFVDPKNLQQEDLKQAKKGWGKTLKEIASEKWGMVILDEINVAVKFGLIPKEEVTKLLKQTHGNLDLVLTGRWAPQEFIEIADLVTEFKEVVHPFKKGEKAKKGIDY